ncbi:alpha/beta hydrolase family protein [Paraferrimonas sedimenticola]|uniref:Prolyl oligopeptidase n=1 Tax=Paraferrimonas sedimenticola TaxID=375674 RepID=A0AA37S045_9GAMM|nr:S9 family peptidase [Paraferrimonas sedimenticola]GLP97957.1 prolyl oligopeptidase [Paraferrimonas sedimenticola]
MRVYIVLFCLIIVVTVNSVFASALPDLKAFAKLPDKSMLTLSPTGKRLAYRDTSEGDRIIVLSLDDGKLISSTELQDVNPSRLIFVSDERLILVAYENERIHNVRYRHNVSAAFSLDLNNFKLHQMLIPGYGILYRQTNVGVIEGFSEDHNYAYMPAYDQQERYNLYRVDLRKKRKPALVQRGTSDTINYFLNKNMEVVARERFNPKAQEHRIQVLEDGSWRDIYEENTPVIRRSFVGLTPDQKHIITYAESSDADQFAYFNMRLSDGRIDKPTFGENQKSVRGRFSTESGQIEGVVYEGFEPDYDFFDQKLSARFKGIAAALPDNTVRIVSRTPDWSKIVMLMEGYQTAGDYILYENSQLRMLASRRPDIPRDAVADVKIDGYLARDGWTIPTLLTIPPGAADKPMPSIVLPHGGPASHDKLEFDWLSQFLASRGYLVIQPQFRGSTGFGPEHRKKGRGEWGKGMQTDLTDAVAAYVERGLVNPERVCIMGWSYGGYAALAGIAFTPEVFRCAVSINGVSDMVEFLKTSRLSYGKYSRSFTYWQNLLGKGESPSTAELEAISPIDYVEHIKHPVLLIHGENDAIVKSSQSSDMYSELKSENKPVEYLEIEDGDHGLNESSARIQSLIAIEQFLEKNLGGNGASSLK